MSYLKIEQITKMFNQQTALKKVSVGIEKGEFVTLLGPSGCGKSTLLRIIAGLDEANEGEITLNTRNLDRVPVHKRNIGMVFQAYSLFPNMTVFENIAFGLKLRKHSKPEIKDKVLTFIKLVGLEGKEYSYPHQLSGGQAQRVALARALVIDPDVLLLDEPLSALDAKIRLSLRYLIKDIQRELKITTIFVTHDQEEALSLSDRIFVMSKGSIVQSGSPEQIYKRPANEFVASFIGTYNFIEPALLNLYEDRNQILVRPEHIEILESSNAKRISDKGSILDGIVENVYFLGNILRLHVLVNNCRLIVDVLNREKVDIRIQDPIHLFVPAEHYIRLS